MAPSRRFYEEKLQREEERRQKELDRRKEEAQERLRAEEKERQREEERREGARREALEFGAALERGRLKREETLARLRQEKRTERRETDREMKRRDELTAALREANREKQREEARKDLVQDGKPSDKKAIQTDKRKEVSQERLQEKKEALKQAAALQERRKAPLDEAKKEAAAVRKKELARQDKSQVQKKQAKDEMREPFAGDRLGERKKLEKTTQEEGKRRVELIKGRTEELLSAKRAQLRRAQAFAGRKQFEGQIEREAERREEARRQRLAEQKQRIERAEREAERKEEQQERRSQEKGARERLEGKEECAKTPRPAESAERHAARRPLESRLPGGLLSGSLPWLLTYDSKIVTAEGEVVFLRGINLPSLDELHAPEGLGLETAIEMVNKVLAEVLSWGANIIRLGISPARLLGGGAASSGAYLALVDALIARASAGDCYTAVYLIEKPEDKLADSPYLSSLSYNDLVDTLRPLAERYASEAALLLDLGCPPGDLLEGETPSRKTAWAAWIAMIPNLVADLRETHPRAFCFVGGLDGATDVTGFPVTGPSGRPIPSLVYRASIFPSAVDPWAQVRRLASGNPVFVSEWGGGSMDAQWGERVAVTMETIGIGWAAAFRAGELALLKPMQGGRFTLTPFGAVVKRALSLASQRAEASQLTRFSITM